jgi:hypothetical protein
MAKKLGAIAQRILEVLKAHPQGLDIARIREIVAPTNDQEHFDRRLRSIYPLYKIDRIRSGGKLLYVYRGVRAKGEWDYEDISKDLRAKVLAKAGSRCQMCGRTVEEDNIKLHVDHKVPRSWGGRTEEENLWAICQPCNEGKKNFFSSLDSGTMKKVMNYPSVHKRIAELLHLKQGQWVDCDLIELVANFNDYQADWQKRLRELRYLGLKIEPRRTKTGKRSISQYRLTHWAPLPKDPTSAARKYERDRAVRNKPRLK